MNLLQSLKWQSVTILSVIAWFLLFGIAHAQTPLTVVEHQVTATTSNETLPTLGNDGTRDLVVYTKWYVLNNGFPGPGDIYYQYLTADGQADGAPVQVTSDITDDRLNDVSGNYIVYTAYDDVASPTGYIMLYNIANGQLRSLSRYTYDEYYVRDPKIYGHYVVWLQGLTTASEVILYDINVNVSTSLGGPMPPASEVQIGSRFVVWSSRAGPFGAEDYDIEVFDFSSNTRYALTNTPSLDETSPTTNGDWVAWQVAPSPGGAPTRIEAYNGTTGEYRTIVDDGASNRLPRVDGSRIAWEGNVTGNFDVYVHRLDTSETFQVTTEAQDQYLNDLFGKMVAYVDTRNGHDEDIYVSHFNQLPVAVAGPDQTVHQGDSVSLDGTASSDPDGDYPLTYVWKLYNFGAVGDTDLSDQLTPSASDPKPSFIANYATPYTVYLGVIDSDITSGHSETDRLTISTTNSPPVADAGADRFIDTVGTVVTLDGSQSVDNDGDPLNYTWSLTALPVGSSAELDFPQHVDPSFIADVNGEYRATLVVNDGWTDSEPDEVIVSFNNVAPVADAGGNKAVTVGDTVTLTGSGTDANGDPLTYQWSFVSWPDVSPPALVSATTPTASFVADAAGTYILSLVVNDGIVASAPDNVSILATTSQDQIVGKLESSIGVINALPSNVFNNKNRAHTLTNKLLAVIALIDDGDYVQARNKLANDVIAKTDGCAISGLPDRNDWITSCEIQGQVYPLLQEILALLDQVIGA